MLNRWRVVGKLGQGAFGQTLEADDTVLNKRVAIKFETGTAAKQVLKLEISILKRLQGTIEIGHPPAPQTYMVMSLLGTNLSDLRKQQPGNKFSTSTTALLGKQMIEALKWVHQSGYLHRDVKPSNFVMGLEKYPDERGVPRARCYIIDFGLSRRYMTPEGSVREARSTAGFRGTARYASLNAHESKELARRDDFWSIFYLLTEFLVGHLPWRKEKDRDAVYRIKRACTSPALVDGLPGAMLEMYYHLRSLAYTSVPDYALMQRLMDDMFDEARVPAAVAYDWETKVAAPAPVAHAHHQQARRAAQTPA
ncbi:kinase-like domain-containing protein [Catenaria anguillulae PL171]|uniref:non-specific serine/threonine protein kinase n=1 Tax=Catenaria anguillulae PL171 TaxID=765915 RepID=A0A1Y2HAN9_9FUNG|nr:kinase-like domain-containing protein [Catenaria anguillulae PL171]